MLKYITKVKLLFLYIFYVLYVLLHSKLLSRDGARARPRFYVLGERKIVEETYLHLKLPLPNGGRARVHYIGFKVLEKITKRY